ncbi:IclR family transcriptional regulator [Hansschlegelia zhihuaiae]|uniref:IclR family transcriptional regulator n=1 Tax=Hansschlegelia zhihuaiae TaxID=405005 RepID=A0A4Q0MGV9_9HYPH|nr:IclR family transcriptional regulator [Hansschlegelia zhihuaiae]RXF72787.1 IclR family transcriptional regulator [Hansschlegelia zhihuaiae]
MAKRGASQPTDPEPAAAKGGSVVRLDEALGGATALKHFAFLECIAQVERPLSVSELSALLNVPQPTAHRIVHMLESEGFLQREPGVRKYAPGERLVRLGFGVVAISARTAPRRAILEAVSKEIGETCNFGIRVGGHLMYLDRVEAKWPFGLRFEPGSRVPLHCTSMGKLFLSATPTAQRRRLLSLTSLHRYTENTVTDPAALEDELARIRAEDLSIDNQEFLAGVVCAAVPVRTPNGKVVAGLAVSAPVARMSIEQARGCAPLLREAAAQLGATFGDWTAQGANERKKRRGGEE